jgi:prepilin signal peptidase PulO-like enzyme (type II secretory pathway)
VEVSVFYLLKFILITAFGFIAMVFDLFTRRIPNKLVLTMIIVWFVLLFPLLFFDTGNGVGFLLDSLCGLAMGGGLFILVYSISKKGLGGGDVKFMSAAGLYLGFAGTIPAILYGTVLAAIVCFILIILKKIGRKDSIPLAPFLFVGILVTVFSTYI